MTNIPDTDPLASLLRQLAERDPFRGYSLVPTDKGQAVCLHVQGEDAFELPLPSTLRGQRLASFRDVLEAELHAPITRAELVAAGVSTAISPVRPLQGDHNRLLRRRAAPTT